MWADSQVGCKVRKTTRISISFAAETEQRGRRIHNMRGWTRTGFPDSLRSVDSFHSTAQIMMYVCIVPVRHRSLGLLWTVQTEPTTEISNRVCPSFYHSLYPGKEETRPLLWKHGVGAVIRLTEKKFILYILSSKYMKLSHNSIVVLVRLPAYFVSENNFLYIWYWSQHQKLWRKFNLVSYL